MQLRLPRRWKAALWQFRDLIRPPRLDQVPEDDDPYYSMLAASPAWARRMVLAHTPVRRRHPDMAALHARHFANRAAKGGN